MNYIKQGVTTIISSGKSFILTRMKVVIFHPMYRLTQTRCKSIPNKNPLGKLINSTVFSAPFTFKHKRKAYFSTGTRTREPVLTDKPQPR